MVFKNDDAALIDAAGKVMEERRKAGLDGLVGGLECVIIRTEPARLIQAAQELLDVTGLAFESVCESDAHRTVVLKQEGGADFLLYASTKDNPFRAYNAGPKSAHLPDTRLETFAYKCPDVRAYHRIQKERGVAFLSEPWETDHMIFLQTAPSAFTGNSVGLIQWKDREGAYIGRECRLLDLRLEKPDWPHLKHIFELDHTATRVKAQDRDPAILEFMGLTNYRFDFAVYVEMLNSITNVARLSADDYAQVFTSGIEPFTTVESSGPTEKFIYNYGLRVHHMAFRTEEIESVYDALAARGMGFLVRLVGSREEGLKQTFSNPSPHTLLVNEYIHRYDGFDGFFTKSNVTELTRATDKQ